jgi:hypothetical protein
MNRGLLSARGAAIVFGLLAFAALASACSVPVFRYALERWDPAPYRLVVFHRGPLSGAQQTLATSLASNSPLANVTVEMVDVAASIPDELEEIWKRHEKDLLPYLAVLYPPGSAARGETWGSPLTVGAVKVALQSPVRRQIARRLLGGDCGVWVLLESGVAAVDDAAAKTMEARLRHLEKTLALPKVDQEDLAKGLMSVPEARLKVAFSMVRLSRKDPAEEVLVHMLSGSEDDLREEKEPMAFPVFGRGRALFALVGKGIGEEMIDEACSFLIGPCSCVVKEENPGLDLLIAEDWDGQIEVRAVESPQPPELTGLTATAPATNATAASLPSNTPAIPATPLSSPVSPMVSNPPPPLAPTSAPLLTKRLLLLAVLAVGIVGAATLMLRRQSHRNIHR